VGLDSVAVSSDVLMQINEIQKVASAILGRKVTKGEVIATAIQRAYGEPVLEIAPDTETPVEKTKTPVRTRATARVSWSSVAPWQELIETGRVFHIPYGKDFKKGTKVKQGVRRHVWNLAEKDGTVKGHARVTPSGVSVWFTPKG
jgi:hypothetical protein